MPPYEKDIKILWAKAAGRCSMPKCPKKKLIEPTEDLPSSQDVFGQNAHIVAEEPGGPRGDSVLPIKERNRYPNLILLCKTHHEMVDQDVTAWPIEKLHQVKADHELWVETCLVQIEDMSLGIHSDLVMTATEALWLQRWRFISDHAIRGLLPEDFVDGADAFTEKVFRANWPEAYPELRAAIEGIAARANSFVSNYIELVVLRPNGFYAEDRSWKATMLPQHEYKRLDEQSREWRQRHMDLLFNLVHALNLFAEEVRRCLNPRYFTYEGKFAVYDDMGVTNEGVPCMYIPDRYRADSGDEGSGPSDVRATER